MGSPPLTRGTPAVSHISTDKSGITPAYAGNTAIVSYKDADDEDHPRLRGEHLFVNIVIFNIVGSPPLTRGTLNAAGIKVSGDRITPAYAGNTYLLQ